MHGAWRLGRQQASKVGGGSEPGPFLQGRKSGSVAGPVQNLENHDSRVRACRCVCGRLLRQPLSGMYKAKERDLSFTLAILPGAFGFELGQNEAMSAARISGAGPRPGSEAAALKSPRGERSKSGHFAPKRSDGPMTLPKQRVCSGPSGWPVHATPTGI